ncbi:MAG TPA: hypothetical protein VK211_20955, partial [Kamptonema sp.]|nr:hypothetical protein [Kamptonema sp.]
GWRFNFTSLFSNFFSQLRLRNSVNIDELFLESTQNRYRYLPMIAKLFWRNNQLQLHFKPGHTWFFNALQPGLYWLRFIGSDLTSSELSSDLEKREEIGSKQATTQFVNLRIVEPTGTDKNAVEVDGVIFETLIPEKILNVPPTQQGAYTPVQIGIRITNNTSTPYSFSLFATLIPQLVGANAQVLRGDYLRTIELRPKESNFPLIMPFESVTFFPDARLLYFKGIPFRLSIAAGDGGYWIFDGLNLGNYQIKLMYKNKATVKEIYGLESTSVRLMQGLWTGLVSTPYVKFFLV